MPPTTLVNRRHRRRHIHPDSVDRLRIAQIEQERCDVCANLWPATMMRWEDGRRVCPNDFDIIRDGGELKAEIEEADAAHLETRNGYEPRPQKFPVKAEVLASVTRMERAGGSEVSQVSPLQLNRTVATALVLRGFNLSASDTISASTGITVAPVVDSATQVTVTLTAGAGMTPGDHYNFIHNRTTYRALLRVR